MVCTACPTSVPCGQAPTRVPDSFLMAVMCRGEEDAEGAGVSARSLFVSWAGLPQVMPQLSTSCGGGSPASGKRASASPSEQVPTCGQRKGWEASSCPQVSCGGPGTGVCSQPLEIQRGQGGVPCSPSQSGLPLSQLPPISSTSYGAWLASFSHLQPEILTEVWVQAKYLCAKDLGILNKDTNTHAHKHTDT